MDGSSARSGGRRPVGAKGLGTIAVAVLIGLYAFVQPRLNNHFGWNLPGLHSTDRDNAASTTEPILPTDRKSGDIAPIDRGNFTDTQSHPSGKRDRAVSLNPYFSGSDAQQSKSELRYGLLRETGPDRYMSPQGLQYLPGSAEGHRLEHLRRHTKDQPSRSGKHGVFDGGMEGALATIDNAYERAKKKQRTTKQIDRSRTIYTVDMGRRVGYVGGREGNRRHRPMARRVKLVLDGTQVITAFPL